MHTLSEGGSILGSGPCLVLGPGMPGQACLSRRTAFCLSPPDLPEPSKRTRPTFAAAEKLRPGRARALPKLTQHIRTGLRFEPGFLESDRG